MLWALLAPIPMVGHLSGKGKPAEAIAPLKAGIAFWEASGGKLGIPTLKARLAEAMALTGDLDNALHLLDEAIAQIERPGWEERHYYAEILRLKGWMLSLKGDLEGAERNFLASLDWARRQQAKPGSCARQRASHDCGKAKANARTRMSCSPRFTAGSPKASTPRICWTRRLSSPNWVAPNMVNNVGLREDAMAPFATCWPKSGWDATRMSSSPTGSTSMSFAH